MASDSGPRPEEIVVVPSCCRSTLLVPRLFFGLGGGLRASATTDPARDNRSVPIIGVVVFLTHKNERVEALLDADGTWRCPVLPVLDRVLNILHEPRRNSGPDMPFGHTELIRVAAWLKGVAKIHRSRPVEPG